MSEMLPPGFAWNELVLEDHHPMNEGLLTLVAFRGDRSPRLLGTGFVVAASQRTAIGCTAAHVFSEARNIQNPTKRHHPAALTEFLPTATPLDIDRRLIRALCFRERKMDMAFLNWVAADEDADVAYFSVSQQDPAAPPFFDARFQVEQQQPTNGDEIAILGYAGMEVADERRDGGHKESFTLGRRLLMRVGRVVASHPKGLRLCKGSCVETTVPVFPGMSGSPVFRFDPSGPMQPFGLVSADVNYGDDHKSDRSIAGSSVVSRLNARYRELAGGQQETLLELNRAMLIANQQQIEGSGI